MRSQGPPTRPSRRRTGAPSLSKRPWHPLLQQQQQLLLHKQLKMYQFISRKEKTSNSNNSSTSSSSSNSNSSSSSGDSSDWQQPTLRRGAPLYPLGGAGAP